MFVIHIYEKAAHGIKTTHRLSAAIYHLFPLNRHIQHFSVLGGVKLDILLFVNVSIRYLMLLLMLLQHFSSFHKKSGKVSYLDSIILAQVLAIFPDFLVSFSWSYFALSFISGCKFTPFFRNMQIKMQIFTKC